jgi:hypothetical protein
MPLMSEEKPSGELRLDRDARYSGKKLFVSQRLDRIDPHGEV